MVSNNPYKFLLLALVLVLAGCISSEKKEARDFITKDLKDPASTEFRNEVFKDNVLCGELNSKNSYGAYVGFKKFVSGREPLRNTQFGGVEGNAIQGENAGLEVSKLLIAYSIKTRLKSVQLRYIQKRVNLTLSKIPENETISKYSEWLSTQDFRITDDTTDNQIDALAQELTEPIYFEKVFNKYCSPNGLN